MALVVQRRPRDAALPLLRPALRPGVRGLARGRRDRAGAQVPDARGRSPAHVGRAARRLPVGRPRLEQRGGARAAPHRARQAPVLHDRLQEQGGADRGHGRRPALRAARGRAPRRRPPHHLGRSRDGGRARQDGLLPGRAAGRPGADQRALHQPARAAPGHQGAALGRGRRRHLHRLPPALRAAARAASGRGCRTRLREALRSGRATCGPPASCGAASPRPSATPTSTATSASSPTSTGRRPTCSRACSRPRCARCARPTSRDRCRTRSPRCPSTCRAEPHALPRDQVLPHRPQPELRGQGLDGERRRGARADARPRADGAGRAAAAAHQAARAPRQVDPAQGDGALPAARRDLAHQGRLRRAAASLAPERPAPDRGRRALGLARCARAGCSTRRASTSWSRPTASGAWTPPTRSSR